MIHNVANSAASDLSPRKDEIITLLNKAIAAGYKAIYQYMIAAELIRGNAKISEALDFHSFDDQGDVRQILKRVIELEGTPITWFDDITVTSPEFRDPSDKKATDIVKQTLETEADAIKLYQEIIQIARESEDFVTESLITRILEGEVAQERIFQNFLEDLEATR